MLPTAKDSLGDDDFIFQDDNASCHRSKIVQEWFHWSVQSPYLNPIDNFWREIALILPKTKNLRKLN